MTIRVDMENDDSPKMRALVQVVYSRWKNPPREVSFGAVWGALPKGRACGGIMILIFLVAILFDDKWTRGFSSKAMPDKFLVMTLFIVTAYAA
ncbi:MAG: hypothetical protein LBS89_04810, partial [Zoogloeaceae bacterium]|nr:hypothetical protein [Zoogloeaceae bacterium]